MKCVVYDREIPKERLEQKRRILTCSKKCSNKRYATSPSARKLSEFREKKEKAKQEEVI